MTQTRRAARALAEYICLAAPAMAWGYYLRGHDTPLWQGLLSWAVGYAIGVPLLALSGRARARRRLRRAVPPTVTGYAIGTRHQGPVAVQRPGRGAS